MKLNFPSSLKEVLVYEGGWADHPKDPGGATMKGVTIAVFAKFKGRKVTKAELRNISDADLQTIYKTGYWDKVAGDLLPSGLDHVAFDGAVNSGPSRGARWLQSALGVKADGQIGNGTLAAARSSDPVAVIKRACQVRMGFLRGLKTWGTFGKGWSRRVAHVEVFAVKLAGMKQVASQEAASARTSASKETKGGAAVSGSGGVGGLSIEGLPDWGLAAIVLLAVVAGVILLGQARHNRNRAEAYDQLASET